MSTATSQIAPHHRTSRYTAKDWIRVGKMTPHEVETAAAAAKLWKKANRAITDHQPDNWGGNTKRTYEGTTAEDYIDRHIREFRRRILVCQLTIALGKEAT